MLTTEFKNLHNLSDRQFNLLHGKVREIYLRSLTDEVRSQIDVSQCVVKREGSVQWVILYPELFEAELSKRVSTRKTSKKVDIESIEVIDGEIVETHSLSNGSQLVVRSEMIPAPFVPTLQINTETKRTDLSQVDQLIERLSLEVRAKKEVEQLTDLVEHAQHCEVQKKSRDLVEMLIAQGYSAESAVKIAQGASQQVTSGK